MMGRDRKVCIWMVMVKMVKMMMMKMVMKEDDDEL